MSALRIEPPFGADEVKRAFREVALSVHPDHGGSDAAMRAAIEARDVLVAELKRNPSAFSRPKPKPKSSFDWHRSAKGNLTTRLPGGEWLTVFRTKQNTYKWACAKQFSYSDWTTEELAVEAAIEKWA